MKSLRSRKRRRLSVAERVKRDYNRLSNRYKKYLQDDIAAVLTTVTHDIQKGLNLDPTTGKRVSAYELLKTSAQILAKHSGENTLRDLYRRFRTEESAVYAKYNSYMYRQGYSASQYFLENAYTENRQGANGKNGSIIEVYVELPRNSMGRISYNMLTITFDYSGDYMEANMY